MFNYQQTSNNLPKSVLEMFLFSSVLDFCLKFCLDGLLNLDIIIYLIQPDKLVCDASMSLCQATITVSGKPATYW